MPEDNYNAFVNFNWKK